MKDFLLEICVDSFESARRAAENGANRLELCANLLLGGTTPSPTLIRQAVERLTVPVNVLIRPRFGDFCYTKEEKEEMIAAIADCASVGANGVVIGALAPDGSLDMAFLEQCMAHAAGMSVTLHRCFDVCRDPLIALEQAVTLGIDTILTSGQQSGAVEGMELLALLQKRSRGRLHLMAGSGVHAGNIPLLHRKTGITHFHLSGKHPEPGPMLFRREGVPMGLPMASEFDRQYTDPDAVQAAVRAIQGFKG